jgi:shikimate dehydrogenase
VRRAAVLGSPIRHSLSPLLHRAAYAALGLDWRYDAVECAESALPRLLAGLDASWVGLSLTMPLKEAVLPLLDEVAPEAARLSAVNTVLLRAGRRYGDNTDVDGLVAALREAGAFPTAGGGTACVLGGGATARSAVAALARLGWARVEVYARSRRGIGQLERAAAYAGLDMDVRPWERAVTALAAPVVVSTVPAGVADVLADMVPPSPGALVDVVYSPASTPVARAWARSGGSVSEGRAVLLHQAARQVELMTGRVAPLAAMRAALTSPT